MAIYIYIYICVCVYIFLGGGGVEGEDYQCLKMYGESWLLVPPPTPLRFATANINIVILTISLKMQFSFCKLSFWILLYIQDMYIYDYTHI